MSEKYSLVLCSQSPRRYELLQTLNIPFSKVKFDFDETVGSDSLQSSDIVTEIVRSKFRQAREQFSSKLDGKNSDELPRQLLLVADTVVVCLNKAGEEGNILGKPKDHIEATKMLESLSGTGHFVKTGVLIGEASSGEVLIEFVESTTVIFRSLSSKEISDYIERDNVLDKAGSYGIQSGAIHFVERIEGCYSNIVGLPVARIAKEIEASFPANVSFV